MQRIGKAMSQFRSVAMNSPSMRIKIIRTKTVLVSYIADLSIIAELSRIYRGGLRAVTSVAS
jgi:hypothetical protein